MSASATEDQTGSRNPYAAPASAPSPFAKSYITLAIVGGCSVIAMLSGILSYLNSAPRLPVDANGPTLSNVKQVDAYSRYAQRAGQIPPTGVEACDAPSSNYAEPKTAP